MAKQKESEETSMVQAPVKSQKVMVSKIAYCVGFNKHLVPGEVMPELTAQEQEQIKKMFGSLTDIQEEKK